MYTVPCLFRITKYLGEKQQKTIKESKNIIIYFIKEKENNYVMPVGTCQLY
jgi:hypothetical protein